MKEWMMDTQDKEQRLRDYALELTVDYFKEKQVSEEVFMKHLQDTYNFLLTGKV